MMIKVKVEDINGWVVNSKAYLFGEELEVSEETFNSAVNGGVKLERIEKNKNRESKNAKREI